MITCKSPRKVLKLAHELAQQFLPDYGSKFSRQDFTRPQLFACLVVREHQKKSYRGVEALLEDAPEWRADIGLARTPDHNTLCRAFGEWVKPGLIKGMLDQTAEWARQRGMLRGGRRKPLSIDSSMFESHHVSRHFEKRCRQTELKRSKKQREKHANTRRRQVVRRLPKLSLAVASSCHLILAARATTGAGSDHPHFETVLFDARHRANVKCVVADAGYDSERNHCVARDEMGVRSIIPPSVGRPTSKRPSTRHRRNMYHRFKRNADKTTYGQRWQSETVNSMLKRNLGSALRALTSRRRSYELLLRAVTHNLMLLC